jgi:hypothetical protein
VVVVFDIFISRKTHYASWRALVESPCQVELRTSHTLALKAGSPTLGIISETPVYLKPYRVFRCACYFVPFRFRA